jgi:heterodisulfide reductase subunit A2
MADNRDAPRIGVYVCHCGGNISDVVDVKRVATEAASLPGVAVARDDVFMCSDPGQNLIIDDIKNQGLDRVVVASCSPKLHETTFRNALVRAGLNQYLYENVNIREQVSWTTGDRAEATAKAAALVRAAVAKASLLAPLTATRVPTTPRAAVIGGGVAGMRAALDLAESGIDVTLVERSAVLGGSVALLDRLFPTSESAADIVTGLAEQVLVHPRMTVYTRAEVEQASGYVGNFSLRVKQAHEGAVLGGAAGAGSHGRRAVAAGEDSAGSAGPGSFVPFEGYVPAQPQPFETPAYVTAESPGGGRIFDVTAGAIVVATGLQHYRPPKDEYGFGKLPQVVTLPDFIKWLSGTEDGAPPPSWDGRPVRSVAFIHCVGSRQIKGVAKPASGGTVNEYCSRVCCTAVLQAACELREKHPSVSAYDFYQDIRTYGRGHEDYYERASRAGVLFVRYAGEQPPTVTKTRQGDSAPVLVRCKDGLTWGEDVEAAVDLVVLAVGMEPGDASSLVGGLKLPVGTDRFLLEVHPKLRPVELAVNGVYLAGTSQGPKDVGESCASASAAAAKVMTLLSADHVELDPFVAHVDAQKCEGHALCVKECEYAGALTMQEYPDGRRRAVVNPALCAGCGACVAVCPARAIDLAGWTLDQYEAMVDALIQDVEVPAR